MNKIITIGREFGSGGREIGRRLSDALGIAYYDQEVIVEIAKRTKLSEQYVHQIMEHRSVTPFPIHFGCSFYNLPNPAWDQNMAIYKEQRDIILEMAQKSDCVIVGRCADYILRDMHPFRLFIYADMESKLRRCREKAPETSTSPTRSCARRSSRWTNTAPTTTPSIPTRTGATSSTTTCASTPPYLHQGHGGHHRPAVLSLPFRRPGRRSRRPGLFCAARGHFRTVFVDGTARMWYRPGKSILEREGRR